MEPRSKKPISTRAAVDAVRSSYPPGTELRNKEDGRLYVIGVKTGMSDFWMMRGNEKGTLSAARILSEFEKVTTNVG